MKLKTLLPERMSPPTFKKTDRVHASVDLPVDILLRRYGTPRQPRGPKPKGFWYAFGNEWIDWVNSDMPQWKSKYSYYYLVDEQRRKRYDYVWVLTRVEMTGVDLS